MQLFQMYSKGKKPCLIFGSVHYVLMKWYTQSHLKNKIKNTNMNINKKKALVVLSITTIKVKQREKDCLLRNK